MFIYFIRCGRLQANVPFGAAGPPTTAISTKRIVLIFNPIAPFHGEGLEKWVPIGTHAPEPRIEVVDAKEMTGPSVAIITLDKEIRRLGLGPYLEQSVHPDTK
jgi:hypothetical protein